MFTRIHGRWPPVLWYDSLVAGSALKLQRKATRRKIPHMSWKNNVRVFLKFQWSVYKWKKGNPAKNSRSVTIYPLFYFLIMDWESRFFKHFILFFCLLAIADKLSTVCSLCKYCQTLFFSAVVFQKKRPLNFVNCISLIEEI